MMTRNSTIQRITRLTPLEAVLALIDARVEAVKPQRRATAVTAGYTLAENVEPLQRPEHAIALRDGLAVEAAATADASSYTPLPLAEPIHRIEVGESMPEGTDAVLPIDAVAFRGARAEAVAPVTKGDGVLPAGGDTTPRSRMRLAGQRMRSVDVAAMCAASIKSLSIREPRIAVVLGSEPATRPLPAVRGLLVHTVIAAGANVSGNPDITAIADENNDAIIAVGGTGSGQRDTAVRTLAQLGSVEMHGIAISPGETAAFGFANRRPVLLVPGRLDAALAAWLLIGRHIAAKLSGGVIEDKMEMLPLKRKVTSTIGITELVPVSFKDGMADPLASDYLSFESLSRSDGWIVVPAESEGFPAAVPVAVHPWP